MTNFNRVRPIARLLEPDFDDLPGAEAAAVAQARAGHVFNASFPTEREAPQDLLERRKAA